LSLEVHDLRKFLLSVGACVVFGGGVFANAATKNQEATIGLLAAEPQWLSVASKIAAKLDHENGMRVIPMLGEGGLRGLNDLSNLPMVDAAIISSDSLIYASNQDLLDGQQNKFGYIAKLSSLDVVLIAKRGISSAADLVGKRIATGPAQSAAYATGELLLGGLNISYTRIAKQDDAAVNALINGEADAALILGTDISTSGLSDGRFHILKLEASPELAKIYQPAILTARELPGLIIGNQTIETLATSLTLAIVDRPRDNIHRKSLENFTSLMFKLPGGESGANLAAAVLGWKRHAEAQKILGQSQENRSQTIKITPTGGKP
jgi:uncharacterized protein